MHGLDCYDYGARYYDAVISQFTTIDPLAEKYYSISPYAYCAGNPVMFMDPDGRYLESVWDAASLIMGVVSFKSNIQQGNIGDAVVDGLDIVADGIALALPGIPGGVGAGIKGARVAGKSIDGVKAIDKTNDVRKNVKFDSGADTSSKTSKEAFRKAKDSNGIPRSKQPEKVRSEPDHNTGEPLKLYEFKNSKGESVVIRKDNPVKYLDGGHQGPHYNAGKGTIEEKIN